MQMACMGSGGCLVWQDAACMLLCIGIEGSYGRRKIVLFLLTCCERKLRHAVTNGWFRLIRLDISAVQMLNSL